MELKEFKKMIFNMVIENKDSGIYYSEEEKDNIEEFIKRGYFINGRFGRDRTLLFSKKLISQIKNRRKK